MDGRWWKDPLFYIVVAVISLWTYSYWNYTYAESVTLTWTAPTEQQINCQTEPVENLAGFRIYELVADIDDPSATTLVIDERSPGDQTYVSTAYNTAGNESLNSNPATKTVGPLRVTNTTAYVIGTVTNAILFFVAGTVPLGTFCFDNQSVNGRYAFDIADFTPTLQATKPLVVYAQCG